jgi:hypothetical protein
MIKIEGLHIAINSCLLLLIRIANQSCSHACNPSYSEGRDQEDHGSRPPQAKVHKTPFQKLGAVLCTCHSCFMGNIGRSSSVHDGQGINVRPYVKNS